MPPAEPRATTATPPRVDPGVRPRWRVDLLVAVVALGLATWITGGLWGDLAGRAVAVNISDQAFFEWVLAYGAHALTHGEDPLLTSLLNTPDGVNLAVNTSVTVHAALLAPLTLLIGPPATFAVILTLNLAGTAYAWHRLLSRHVVTVPAAAVLGGLFCGFAPGLVSHANGHLNWSAGWVAPVLLAWVLRLREPGRRLRNGAVLGALVAVGFSVAAEALFSTALACGVFLGTWALHPAARHEARRALPTVLRALAVTAAVAGALLAYPLWLHFLGPQSFSGTGFSQRVHAEDVAAYGAYPAQSLAGRVGLGTGLAANPTEEGSFFGLPLLVLAPVCLALLWRHAPPGRRATLRALAVTGVVFAVLSWGPRLKILGWTTAVPLPYAVLDGLPLFNAALPARLALVVAPVIGVLLASTVDRLVRARPASRRARLGWVAAFVVALLPLVPAPMPVTGRSPIPHFITSGAWQAYVADGGVLAPAPVPSALVPDGQRWQAYALADGGPVFAIPGGYFLGPGGVADKGRVGTVPRPTDTLLAEVAGTGVVPPIGADERAAAREDLRFWGAEVVVLADRLDGSRWRPRVPAVLRATTELLGPPERVDDVWLWRVPRS